MRTTLSSGLLTASALCVLSSSAMPQRVTTVPEGVVCGTCSILVRKRTLLGQKADMDQIHGFPERVRQDRRGRYWIFRQSQPPVIFDEDGQFLQLLGPKGQGPGEYIAPHDALFVEDSIVVFDARQRRASVLDSGLKPVRTLFMPSYLYRTTVVSWPDSIITADRIPGPSSVGWPLHLVSFLSTAAESKGSVLKSFGPGDGQARPVDITTGLTWLLTPVRNGLFWAASPASYDLTQWTTNGLRLSLTISRRPSWFGESQGGIGSPKVAPAPVIAGIDEDEQGFVWAFVHIPHPSWKDAWGKPRADGGEFRISDVRHEKFYRTRIEVIDPKTARILARTSLDGFYVVNALGGRGIAVCSSDEERGERVSILRFELVGLKR